MEKILPKNLIANFGLCNLFYILTLRLIFAETPFNLLNFGLFESIFWQIDSFQRLSIIAKKIQCQDPSFLSSF